MDSKKYTTKVALRIAIYCTVCTLIFFPFWLVSLKHYDNTVSLLMIVELSLLFGGALLLSIIYYVYYFKTKTYGITLSDNGIRIENCAFRIENAKRYPIKDVTIRWDEIVKVHGDSLTSTIIVLKSGEKIGIENAFGGKVRRKIKLEASKKH